MRTNSRNTLSLWLRYICLPLLIGLLAPAAFAQDQGDVMQIFRRAEKQVQQLNKLRSLTQNQALATKRAMEAFAKANSAEEVEQTTRQCLTEFRKNENALENLSGLLDDLSKSFGGLESIKDSVEGERQLKALNDYLFNSGQVFARLAEEDGVAASVAKVSIQQSNMIRGMGEKLRQANTHQKKADQSPSNLERMGELLAQLSVLADVIELKNGLHRQLVVALALYKAPTYEKKEALENLMGEFGTPSGMIEQIGALADSMTDDTTTLLRDMLIGGTGVLPDFSDKDIEDALVAMNRAREDTCEACTDGLDNDLDGKIDALQSATCKLFVDFDPDCVMANASL